MASFQPSSTPLPIAYGQEKDVDWQSHCEQCQAQLKLFRLSTLQQHDEDMRRQSQKN